MLPIELDKDFYGVTILVSKRRFYAITPGIVKLLLDANLTADEWRLWAYLAQAEHHLDCIKLSTPQQVMAECQTTKVVYDKAKSKFEHLGLFEFQETRVEFNII